MEYQIKQLSYYAKSILEALTTGAVHSVYRRTINLTNGRQLLSLQTDRSPLSPISLISQLTADEFSTLSVKTGDEVRFHKDGFTICNTARNPCPSYIFTCRTSEYYELKLSKPLDTPSRLTLTASIQEAILNANTGGFAPLFSANTGRQLMPDPLANWNVDADDSLSLVLTAARRYILQCNNLILDRKYPQAALELTRLLGLGTGLTPSGDDFLCGVLAGFLLSGSTGHPFAKHLRDMLADKLTDTIDISAAFLSCALKNQFSLPVNRLYELSSPKEILTSFETVGHSSGTDTLCGILWSLAHI